MDSVGTPKVLISRLNSPACTCPCQRFATPSRVAGALLGAVVCRSPFDAELFHLLLHAGLSRRFPKITRNRRAVNGAIGLFVPRTVIRQRCALYMSKGRPAQRGSLLHDDDFTIVAKYQAEYAGLVQYYLLAQDVFRLGHLHWVMETSLLKTLAGKHRSTVNSMARKYKAVTETPAGLRKCLQVTVERDRGRKPLVARFGGIPLTRARTAVLTDQRPVLASARRNELIHRLLAGRCEICEDTVNLEVHHVRKLADLSKPGRREKPAWMHLMAMRRRKTLVTCRRCHQDIHAGRATRPYPK